MREMRGLCSSLSRERCDLVAVESSLTGFESHRPIDVLASSGLVWELGVLESFGEPGFCTLNIQTTLP